MSVARSVIFNIIGKDNASKAFLSSSKAADTAAASYERTAARIKKSGAAMQLAGAKMAKSITLPMVAAAAMSADQAVKFQKSMTLIETAADESAKKTAAISKGIKQVAAETGTSLSDLSEGIYTVAKAGAQKWSAAEQLKVLKAAAQGAKAEAVPLGTAVDALTTIMQGYGMKASDAVKAENMLIRGSGLAKTTMQEFAGSLASVVPLAASLQISFPQIAGAIATMTQHGETADRATQNLANLITNLAGQSHQSSAMMQQLGINVVDLQQHLGKRGLVGTLDIVEKALADSSKGGRVVVDAFKKSQTATADLAVELAHMPPSLRKISQQFETGKLSYKEYRKSVRDLGGEQYVLGMNFIGTMNRAKGFSDQLKAGDPTVRTAASTLQKMLGGVTGMRTALMLGGTSAKGFASNVDQVAEAARKSGADVLGWSKTQETLAVKVDKAKASLQVLAVEIGTALIPVIGNIVDKVSAAVHWFEGLSSTDKKFIGYSAVVLAALGPVLGIIGRITRAFGLMWAAGAATSRFIAGARDVELSLAAMESKAYLTGLRFRAMGTAIAGSAALLAGGAIGYGVGSLTQNASTATKALGVLGSAAAGAAIGFRIGGPLGAGIGAVAGGLTDAVKAFHLFGGAAKDQIKPTEAFTQAILADNDALGKNTRKLVENSLQSKGLYDAALKLGISQKTLTDAMMGNKAAAQLVDGVMSDLSRTYFGTYGLSEKQQKAIRAEHDAYTKLKSGIGAVTETLAVNQHAADNIAAADAKQKNATDKVTGSLEAASKATKAVTASGNAYLDTLARMARKHQITVDVTRAIANVKRLAQAIASLPASTQINVGQRYKLAGHARGGSVADGLSVVGEAGYELLDKQGSNLRVIPHGAAAAIMGVSSLPGYASGTDGALQRVLAAIRSALSSAPSTVAGQRAQLAQHIGGAADRQKLADSALAEYRRLNDASKAADRHARALQDVADKARYAAEQMDTGTKAESAAKAAAEKQARALDHQAKAAQKTADAADKLASRQKSAWSKIARSAKAGIQVVQSDVQALVASVQQAEQALAQSISDYESSISSALTSGSDLASIVGQLDSNVSSAKDALDAAQAAMAQYAQAGSGLAAAQQAEARAAADQAAAHKALSAALAGGDAAAILAAQQAQTDAATRLAAAQAAVQAATPTPDQVQARAAAQQQLTDAQAAYAKAVQASSASGVASVLAQFAASEQQFASDLTKLKNSGAGQDLIAQVAGLGAQAGDALAQGLINDPAALASITKSMQAIQSIAATEGDTLAQGFYGSGVASMQKLLAGIEKQFPQTKAALAPLAAQLAAMFTITPTVTGSGSGKGTSAADVSHYYVAHDAKSGAYWDVTDSGTVHLLTAAQLAADLAAGADVRNVHGRPKPLQGFAAGGRVPYDMWAVVGENGPEILRLPGGSDVVPANRAKGSAPFGDIAPLVREVQALRAEVRALPQATGQEVGATQLRVIDQYGQAQADRLRRAGRKL